MESTIAVKQVYIDSLLQLSSVPPIYTPDQEQSYATELDKLYAKHSNVLIQMAKGAYELREHMRKEGQESSAQTFERMSKCHSFLDRFYMSRIGIRVLAGQYLALRQQHLQSELMDPNNDYMGIICKTTSPYEQVLNAGEDATWMCQRQFGDAPEVIVSGNTDLTFPYIPTHLHYILLELLKNAMRATMEKYHEDEAKYIDTDVDIPPINVVIADSLENEDVVIKVSDEGGGIPRSNMRQIWSYLFTTASPSIQQKLIGIDDGAGDNGNNSAAMQDHSIHSPLAGLG